MMSTTVKTPRRIRAEALFVRRRRAAPLVCWLLFPALLAAGPVAGGSLEVKTSAAAVGTFGLDVGLGVGCRPSEMIVNAPAVLAPGDYIGCATLTVSGVSVPGSGTTRFTAGREIGLGEGFKIETGADFVAELDESLSPFAFVEDDSPQALQTYSSVFYLNLDSFLIDADDAIDHLIGVGDDEVLFRVTLLKNVPLNENRLILAARNDSGALVETPAGEQLLVPPGYNRIEISWVAAAGAGHLMASVNSAPLTGLVDLANGEARLESVRWGAISGELQGSSGSLLLDEFSSFR